MFSLFFSEFDREKPCVESMDATPPILSLNQRTEGKEKQKQTKDKDLDLL